MTWRTERLVPFLRDWRSWPDRLIRSWRQSLRFRTLALTLTFTALMILVALVWMALAIQNDLFESRTQQALTQADRATQSAQRSLNAAESNGDLVAAENLMNNARLAITRQSGTDRIAVFRTLATPSSNAPQNFVSGGLTEDMVTPGLRKQVMQNPDLQWWQSVAIPLDNGGFVPGIIVGQQLDVPDVGKYELYLAYDLQAENQTLQFVQTTLWVAGLALLVLIGAISWFVLRLVTTPITEAAESSARIAHGDLSVRLDVKGDDELATLGRSFNSMADSIQTQIEELADLSLVQQRFVSDVSHELRTPLTTIKLASDMLNNQRAEFDPSTARAAELLHDQVGRFETLLTDLLEISRYDAGSVELEKEPTSLAYLAEDVIESMSQLADQRGSDVRLMAPGGYSPVEMDPRRIRRIVRNLLGNAIEHGEGRPIVVTVDSDQRSVALGVRDFGRGMAKESTERVFDRFWRADPSRKRTIGGTGLGLSIALGDATLHGGTLEVWSEIDHGSNFVLTLPRSSADVGATSPIAVDPGDDGAALVDLGLTQPLSIVDLEAEGLEP